MSEKLEITKEKVLKASETCPDAKEVLKELFSEAFEDEDTLTDEFRRKARKAMKELGKLVYEVINIDFDKGTKRRAKWIIANLLHSYLPGDIYTEVNHPYKEMEERDN